MPRPVLFVTNHAPAVPGRRVRRAARARGRRVRADRRRRAPRRRCRRRGAAVPGAQAEPARRAAARRLRALPRGRRGAVGPRRAARRLRSAPAARTCRSSSGRRSGRTRAPRRTRCPTCRCATSTGTADAIVTYGPHVSAYVRTKGAARAGRRGAPERRQRVLVRTGRADPACRFPGDVCRPIGAGKGCGGAPSGLAFFRPVSANQPRWFWSAAARSEPGPPPPARPCS